MWQLLTRWPHFLTYEYKIFSACPRPLLSTCPATHPSALHERLVANLGEWGKARRRMRRAVGVVRAIRRYFSRPDMQNMWACSALAPAKSQVEPCSDTMAGRNSSPYATLPLHYHKLHRQDKRSQRLNPPADARNIALSRISLHIGLFIPQAACLLGLAFALLILSTFMPGIRRTETNKQTNHHLPENKTSASGK